MTFFELMSKVNKKYDNKFVNINILCHVSKLVQNSTDLITHRNDEIDFNDCAYFQLLEDYYEKHIPLAQITHHAFFNGHEFKVNEMVHCPRPETEIMAQTVQILMSQDPKLKSILDLCAGTGCIGLSIALNLPYTTVDLVDNNSKALTNILNNISKYDLEERSSVIAGNYFELIKKAQTKFDVVVMNPPYVPLVQLDKEMTKYEDKSSFCSAANPFAFYSVLLEEYKNIVHEDHFLIACEFGKDQKEPLENMIKNANLLKYTHFYKDLSDQWRFFVIYKH